MVAPARALYCFSAGRAQGPPLLHPEGKMKNQAKDYSPSSDRQSQILARLALLGLAFLLPGLAWGVMAAVAALALLFSFLILPEVAEGFRHVRTLATNVLESSVAYALSVLLPLLIFHCDFSAGGVVR